MSQHELSKAQHELSRSQTLLQSRLEESPAIVVTSPGENNFVFSAASTHEAAPLTTQSLAEKPPLITSSSSVLVSQSFPELNSPPSLPVLRRSEQMKERERTGENFYF